MLDKLCKILKNEHCELSASELPSLDLIVRRLGMDTNQRQYLNNSRSMTEFVPQAKEFRSDKQDEITLIKIPESFKRFTSLSFGNFSEEE